MRTTKKRQRGRALRALTLALVLTLAALLLAGTALAAAKPGAPTAKSPTGTTTQVTPTFTWSKAKGAAKYELCVYQGSKLQLRKTGIRNLSWTFMKAPPTNVALTWKVRASNAAGAGAWSKSLAFKIGAGEFKIGDPYQGGIIAYIDGSGQHGLIAAADDQGSALAWSNITNASAGASGVLLGTGQANTTAIVNQSGFTGGAAKLCNDLVLNDKSDWYLPSKDELHKLYLNKGAIGGFASDDYWSSSEANEDGAWGQDFDHGYQDYDLKYFTSRVRAVRAF